jgi:hypothetical protein
MSLFPLVTARSLEGGVKWGMKEDWGWGAETWRSSPSSSLGSLGPWVHMFRPAGRRPCRH